MAVCGQSGYGCAIHHAACGSRACRVGPGAKGDGIRMAEAAAAAIGGFGAFYGHIHHRNAMTNPQLWPYPHLDAAAELGVLVGPDGKRFTDEGLGGVCMANAMAQLPDPLSAILISTTRSGARSRGSPRPCRPIERW